MLSLEVTIERHSLKKRNPAAIVRFKNEIAIKRKKGPIGMGISAGEVTLLRK